MASHPDWFSRYPNVSSYDRDIQQWKNRPERNWRQIRAYYRANRWKGLVNLLVIDGLALYVIVNVNDWTPVPVLFLPWWASAFSPTFYVPVVLLVWANIGLVLAFFLGRLTIFDDQIIKIVRKETDQSKNWYRVLREHRESFLAFNKERANRQAAERRQHEQDMARQAAQRERRIALEEAEKRAQAERDRKEKAAAMLRLFDAAYDEFRFHIGMTEGVTDELKVAAKFAAVWPTLPLSKDQNARLLRVYAETDFRVRACKTRLPGSSPEEYP